MPSLPQFATADDLAARLGLSLSPDDRTRADSLLQRASGLIQAAAKQQLVLVANDEYTIVGPRDRQITLPERPVVSVSSVVLNGTPLTNWYVDGNELVVKRGILWDFQGDLLGVASFGWRGVPLVITYTHGWETPPEPAGTIAIEAVRRVWVNPTGALSESWGSERTDFASRSATEQPTLELTDGEKDQIRRAFGRRATSVGVLVR